jgi:hypothetical protein
MGRKVNFTNPKAMDCPHATSGLFKAATSWKIIAISYLLWFAALGTVIAYLIFKKGHLWMLLVVLVATACLLTLDESRTRFASAIPAAGIMRFGRVLPLGIVALAIQVTGLPTLLFYFQGDDFAYLHFFHTLSRPDLLSLFHTDLAHLLWGLPGDELRPMYGPFFMLNYKLWGRDPHGYHGVSLLMHFANCLLIFQIVRELTPRQTWRGFLAALLFAVLPLDASVFSWVTGAPAELLPTLFYLAAFLAFMRFRTTRMKRYAVICILSFAGCLLTKETAITLPAILLSFDAWKTYEANGSITGPDRPPGFSWWRRLSRLHAICAVLLVVYLIWRRLVLTSFLKERLWNYVWVGGAVSHGNSTTSLLHQLGSCIRFFSSMEVFNVQNLFTPFPLPLIVAVASIYLYWVVSLWRHRSAHKWLFGPTLYFGLVWYAITNIPLLATNPYPYHLYLPAAGACVALTFLAFPVGDGEAVTVSYFRLIIFGVLILASGWQLRRSNAAELKLERKSESQDAALRTALMQSPQQSLVIIWPTDNMDFLKEIYPRPIEPPFCAVDLHARGNIIVDPAVYISSFDWWQETRVTLNRDLRSSTPAEIELILLSWDDRSNSLLTKSRTLPTPLIRTRINDILGQSVESAQFNPAKADGLMRALAGLAINGN